MHVFSRVEGTSEGFEAASPPTPTCSPHAVPIPSLTDGLKGPLTQFLKKFHQERAARKRNVQFTGTSSACIVSGAVPPSMSIRRSCSFLNLWGQFVSDGILTEKLEEQCALHGIPMPEFKKKVLRRGRVFGTRAVERMRVASCCESAVIDSANVDATSLGTSSRASDRRPSRASTALNALLLRFGSAEHGARTLVPTLVRFWNASRAPEMVGAHRCLFFFEDMHPHPSLDGAPRRNVRAPTLRAQPGSSGIYRFRSLRNVLQRVRGDAHREEDARYMAGSERVWK
ncbi:hypothetical protein B0H19DRAFT_1243753 [Mycena capillaripes]|nr:hypothetical protein B0H19DRAFT_1243753 [Mycena capillaripes]